MSGFNPDDGVLFHKGEMLAHMGATEPSAFWLSAKFIAKCACDNQDLLTTKMAMRLESLALWPLH